MKKEADLCREQFERTESGFDKKNETLKGLKESIPEMHRTVKELFKSAVALGFVAALGAGCSTAEKVSFSVGVDCPDNSNLDVRDTEVQGEARLVCFSDGLNADGELEEYSPISMVDVEGINNDEILDEYDYRLDFDVPYTHQPGREFLNNFTASYDLQADPAYENIEFSEIADEGGIYMYVGRHGITDMKVVKIGEE